MFAKNLRLLAGAFLIGALVWFGLWRGVLTGARAASSRNQLVVGTNVGYPPFIMTDDRGAVIGFDADISAFISQKLGKELVIKDMAFDALLIALKKRKVDMVIGGISLTPEKQKTGLFIPYYGDTQSDVAVFTRAGGAQHSSLESLAQSGAKVCTQSGSIFAQLLENRTGIQLRLLPEISDLVLEVAYGRSDCAVLDVDSVRSLVAQQKNLEMYTIGLDRDDHIHGFGLGVASADMHEKISNIIDQMKRDGVIATLQEKWFGGRS